MQREGRRVAMQREGRRVAMQREGRRVAMLATTRVRHTLSTSTSAAMPSSLPSRACSKSRAGYARQGRRRVRR